MKGRFLLTVLLLALLLVATQAVPSINASTTAWPSEQVAGQAGF